MDGTRSVIVTYTARTVPDRRDDSTRLTEKVASLFSHFVYTASPRDEVRFIGWVQGTRSPFAHRIAFAQPAAAERATSVHLQSQWERRRNADSMWTGFASYSACRSPEYVILESSL